MAAHLLKILVLSAAMLSTPVNAQGPQPPQADIRRTELKKHGHTRIDNYYWLRHREEAAVLEYLTAENEYLEAVMADTKPLQEKLYREIVGRIKQDDSTVPYLDNGYEYYIRFEEGQHYRIYCRRQNRPHAPEEVILDVNQLAKGKSFCSVGGIDVNRSNNLVAFPIDTVGRRIFTLRIKDLTTGKMLDDEVPEMTGNFVWGEDGRTIFYTRQDPQTLRWFQIYRHTVGTDATSDVLVYEETDDTFRCDVSKSRSKDFLFIRSHHTLSSEYRYLDAKRPHGEFQVFSARRPHHEYSIDHIGNHFYIRTNHEAKNFRLLKTEVGKSAEASWEEVIPHRENVLLERFTLFGDHLVVQDRCEGLSHLRIIPWSGEEEHEVDFGESAYTVFAAPTPDTNTTVLRYVYTSLSTPWSTFDYDMTTRRKTLRKQQPVLGGFDAANYVTERLTAEARDGKKVPISIVYRKGITRNGENPCLMQGYGSYGATEDPMFRRDLVSLLDRGFVFAIAHIRGGQMLGRAWYEDGKLLKKKNTFNDFIDCGQFLVTERWADPDRLFARGGSAGGLLIGAVINMRPDLFNGVIAGVPFVDVLTTMLDDTIPLTTSEYDEWGDPNQRAYYDYILSYSPYDNVESKDYPNLLVTSGLHDSQVQYWEPTKWVAKLRALKTDENLLLLKTNMNAGHDGASGRFEPFRIAALQYAFLLRLAGISD